MNRSNLHYHIANQIANSDNEVAGKIFEKEVILTTAEILALFTTPKELVPAPGAGKVLQFLDAVLFLDFNTTAYTTYGIVTIKQGTTAVSDAIAAAALVQQADDCYVTCKALTTEIELTANSGLYLYCDTGNPLAGDSPIKVKITYQILDFS